MQNDLRPSRDPSLLRFTIKVWTSTVYTSAEKEKWKLYDAIDILTTQATTSALYRPFRNVSWRLNLAVYECFDQHKTSS